MLKSLLAPTLLAVFTSAAVMVPEPPPNWQVKNFNGLCARSGCSYDFDVSGPARGSIPSFMAHCSGEEKRTLQTFFAPCNVKAGGSGNIGVSAKYLPRKDVNTGIIDTIAVSLAFNDLATGTAGIFNNYTGTAPITMTQVVAPLSFTITPVLNPYIN
ncbi:putative amino-acid permease [Venturia nashicola]|uniref:Putative amino-acid permease n=1 Tax=Venturia nashicola TaxID=86259 RepID=A0A4Z1P9K3_9PEZI|nr:putative amino-acid permease [Venturia nashicola]